MQFSKGGMGMHKHGISGRATKSPRARFLQKLDAERNERKAKPSTCTHSSVLGLLKQASTK
jgi:hypothetical protein